MPDKIFIEKQTLTDIADAIREKEDSIESIPTVEMAERIRAIESGDGANLEEWCKTIQLRSLNCFGKSEGVLNLNSVTQLTNLFYINSHENYNTLLEHLTINCPNEITAMTSMLYASASVTDTKLKRLTFNVETKKCTGFGHSFYRMHALEHIDGTPLDFSSVPKTSDILLPLFSNVPQLKEVRFKGVIMPSISFRPAHLSKESIESVINCLSDEVEGQTITFDVNCINKNYETSTDANDGSTSEAWAAMVARKPNWTFSLI